MHAPAKDDLPIITLDEFVKYDAYLFGIPDRYGNFPAQWRVRSLFFFISFCASGLMDLCEGVLGYHGTIVVERCARGEVCWYFHFYL